MSPIRELVPKIICNHFNIDVIFLFGSVVNGEMHGDSDIDIAFLGKEKYCEYEVFLVAQKLAEICGREVDLIDLTTASTVFKMQVVNTGEVIFCRDQYAHDIFVIQTFREYEFLAYDRRHIIENIQKTGRVYSD